MLGDDKAVTQHDLSNSNSVYGASLIHPTRYPTKLNLVIQILRYIHSLMANTDNQYIIKLYGINDQVLFMMINANWRDEFFSFTTNERVTA